MMKTYFNSHPHEEDDMTGDVLKVAVRISTHILTKRMTSFHRLKFHFISISTHILTKRMTIVSVIPITSRNISTHILTKRMTEASQNLSLEHIISTHILTKRMTLISNHPHRFLEYFNSHPHEEDDLFVRMDQKML